MSSHLPYSTFVNRSSTSKYSSPSSYSRTSSAPSTNTNSLERSSRAGSYGTSPSRAASYSRFGSASRGYSVEPERPKSPERRVGGLRMGSTSRFGAQIARSPISEKSPTVFGVAPKGEDKLQIVTRGTSPTPPSNSAFLREKRAILDKTLTEFVPRPSFRPICVSAEAQTDERKEETPPPPAVVENPRLPPSSRWSNRPVLPRYSSTGGYSYVRREPEKTTSTSSVSRYGGLGFKPEQTKTKTPSPTRETISKLPKSPSKQILSEPDPAKNISPHKPDILGSVNKDFRKSILNMDLSSQEPPKPPLQTVKSRSNLKLPLNKSLTSVTVGQVNGTKQFTKKDESSSSDETSSSEDETSSEESENLKLKPPDPKLSTSARNSNDESSFPQAKPPASPKSVVVKTLNAASPMKVQFSQESSGEETKKSFPLRKFDSGVKEWWLESHKDIPSAEKQNQSVKGSNKVEPQIGKSSNKPVIEETQIPKPVDNKGFKLRKFDSGERAWWMESNKDIPGTEKKQNSTKKSSEGSHSNSEAESKPQSSIKLKKSTSKTDIPKIKSSQSESDSKSMGLSKLYKSGSKTELSSSNTSLNTALQTASESESRSLGLSKLYGSRSDLSGKSSSSLSRTPSVKSLAGRPPSGVEPVRRSNVLDPPTEYTPGLLRLHGQWAARPIPRVESGQRDWWLEEDEKPSKPLPLGGYTGHFRDIDLYLGNTAPPPAAFRTPNTTDEDSDSSDDGWYKNVALKNHQNGTLNGEKKGCCKIFRLRCLLLEGAVLHVSHVSLPVSCRKEEHVTATVKPNQMTAVLPPCSGVSYSREAMTRVVSAVYA